MFGCHAVCHVLALDYMYTISVFNVFCSRCCIVIKLPYIVYKKRRIESQIVKLQLNAAGNVLFSFFSSFHNYFINYS